MRQRPISYFADMIACPFLAGALSIFALTHFTRLAVFYWCLMVMIGTALWTLIEYVMHRVLYHQVAVFRQLHEVHHTSPQAYVGAPPMVGTGVIFLVSFAPLEAFAPILANGLAVGMLIGYTAYMVVHHACHFWTPTSRGYLSRARMRHAVHHYRDDDGNFGVTSSLWDRVFGTHIKRAVGHSLMT